MPIPDFRTEIEALVRLAVMGPLAVATHGEMPSQFATDINLRSGEKAFQLVVWQIERGTPDSNSQKIVVGVEVKVHRKLWVPEDEALYLKSEMLLDQGRLTHTGRAGESGTWRGLASAPDFADLEEPTIGSAPTKDDVVISYGLTATMRISA